ncbi:MAG: hypothetical protein CHACPFDD_03800 [Phycisphaerae bacterium]|nr:hypothetical protein [Phycisphaerae bacterium]
MRGRSARSWVPVVTCAFFAALGACERQSHDEQAGHDHGGGRSAPAAKPDEGAAMATAEEGGKSERGHVHRAPHGGTLVMLAEHFAFVELVLDAERGAITAYVLDGEAEKAVRIADERLTLRVIRAAASQPGSAAAEFELVELKPVASTLTGETAGDTSQFAGRSAALVGATRFRGVLGRLHVRGQEFSEIGFEFPEGHAHE